MCIYNIIKVIFIYYYSYTVPTSDDGNVMRFERIKQHQGVWPFRCNKLAACDNIRQQSCGCEEEGGDTTLEKAAIVYFFADIIERGKYDLLSLT